MGKREVPQTLKTLLNADVALTNLFCNLCDTFMPLRSLRAHYKVLEISCHGVLWLGGWLVFIWLANNPSLFQIQVNFYIGLLLDILIVAVTKATTRRRRPKGNQKDMLVTVGPDVYSFPSGHATRAVFIATYFLYLTEVPFIIRPPLIAWSASVCLSRVLLRRHHLLDVAVGIVIGGIETMLVCLLWLEQDSSATVVGWMNG